MFQANTVVLINYFFKTVTCGFVCYYAKCTFNAILKLESYLAMLAFRTPGTA